MKQRWLIFVLALCLLLSGCALTVPLEDLIPRPTEETQQQEATLPPAPDFTDSQLSLPGLQTLQDQQEPDGLLIAYDRIAEAAENCTETVDLVGLGIREDQLQLLFACYRNDHPQHFWVKGSYVYSHMADTDQVVELELSYLLTGSALEEARAEFDAATEEILLMLDAGMSDYQRELIIHDALVARCDYLDGSDHAHNAYGALVEGKAVCEGYSEAFAWLLRQAGIPCIIVSGTAGGENHAWNAVSIGGQWYYADATWDDPVSQDPQAEGPIFHAYFNLTRQQMDEDHQAEDTGIALPEATATTYNYHVYNGLVADRFDEDQLAELLDRQDQATVYIAGDVDEYLNELADNIFDLLADAGRDDVRGYSYSICGRELIISLST